MGRSAEGGDDDCSDQNCLVRWMWSGYGGDCKSLGGKAATRQETNEQEHSLGTVIRFWT